MRRGNTELGKRYGSETFHCLHFGIFIILYLMQPIQKLFLFFFFLVFSKVFPDLPPLPAILILYRTTQRVCLYLLSLLSHLYFLSNSFKPRFYPHHSTKAGHYNLHLYLHLILSILFDTANYSLLEVISFVDF